MKSSAVRAIVVLAAAAAVAILAAAGACSESSPNPCSGQSCSSRGYCIVDLAQPYCACIEGFHPEHLACVENDPVDPCHDVDCNGHGSCRVEGGLPVCDCESEYHHPGDYALACAPDTASDGGADDGRDDAETGPICGDGVVQIVEQCDDGNHTAGDGCESDCRYSCQGVADCDDSNPCTTDACAPVASGQLCRNDPDVGATCEDGDPCTTPDTCDAAGLCVPGSGPGPAVPVLLSPPNGWTTGSYRAPAMFGTLRPRFRWTWATETCGAPRFEVQVDDSCTTPGFASCPFPSPEAEGDVTEQQWQPTSDLPVTLTQPVGTRYYWRVRACRGTSCSAWSGVRYLEVGRVPFDVNGDGFSDVVAGSWGRGSDTGVMYVFFGALAGIPSAPSITIPNPPWVDGARFSWVVTGADVDADGFADILAGAPNHTETTAREGAVFFFRGGLTGPALTETTRLVNPAPQVDGHFGDAVAAAGDLNADGFADVVVGARDQDAPEVGEGNAFVYRGGPTGPGTTPDVTLDNPADQANGAFGAAVAGAGDVNNDGFADCLVGAPTQDAPESDEGNAFLYLGGPTGIADVPSATLDNPEDQASGRFGVRLAAAGDANGDGYGDVVVGADQQDGVRWDEGKAFLYHGSSAGLPLAPDLTIGHPTALDDAHFGWDVCSAGDLNADGRADLFLGAYNQSASAASQGAGFLYYGTPLGITSRPDRTLVDPAAPDDAYFGSAAESAGDLNADGYGDLVVGAYRWAGSMVSQEQGRVYVFLGGPAVIDWPPTTTLDDPDTYPGNLFGCDVF